MEPAGRAPPLSVTQLGRLREEHGKVVTSCRENIQHWKKVESDYEALQERLNTLPDKLSYDIMVPFGPLAFMPGKLVHTNEITVLLGDNWFAKCSAKQASGLVEHRKKHVRKTMDDLQKVMQNFESRVEFTEDLQKMTCAAGDFVDIREVCESSSTETKGKQRTALKPHSKPKTDAFQADLQENRTGEKFSGDLKSDLELWARLDELERQEEICGELHRTSNTVEANGEDASSSEEEREEKTAVNVVEGEEKTNTQDNFQKEVTNSELFGGQTNGTGHYYHSDDEDGFAIAEDAVPTIYFSHTVEPKRVRINTGKNTTLKFSEKKEEAKRKRKNSNGNGHSTTELPNIKTPADIYRVFVDVVNGEYVPRKSILKSRSRENSVCSDTSESSTVEFDDRRGFLRSVSYDEATFSDNGDGILEEEEEGEQEHLSKKIPSSFSETYEAFSGTVVEKDPSCPISTPHPVIAHPVLPTIPERRAEEGLSEASEETTKRVSKFKAARMQQKT
ncbi:PREDICTED: unconventional prefoldin RPB5 interactor 1 [Gekko japonicus]|uniref:Unconventional prefoldin RPB5 interactor 1 n=1 Tax=Gekko japonicus TaxID=146911 RepID=A0ABM1K1M5_GEKJA|nr:PREDICTED: unconventional prefoldin RPB5 interactor 1 [Gekko japonicus]